MNILLLHNQYWGSINPEGCKLVQANHSMKPVILCSSGQAFFVRAHSPQKDSQPQLSNAGSLIFSQETHFFSNCISSWFMYLTRQSTCSSSFLGWISWRNLQVFPKRQLFVWKLLHTPRFIRIILTLTCKQLSRPISLQIMFKVLVIGALAIAALSVIHVEPERNVQSVSIRIGEEVEINYPNFAFKDVYAKDIKRFPDEKRMFNIGDICDESPSELILDSLSFFDVKPARPPKAVVYELEDIQNSQAVVDAIIAKDRMYVAFQNATILALQPKPKGDLGALGGLWDLKYDGQINNGQFISTKFGAQVLLITDQKLYTLAGDRPTLVDGYRPTPSFTSAVMIQDRYLAVAQGPTGIAFYQYSAKQLKYLSTLGSSSINRTNFHLQDLAYDGKSTLFLLDRNFGMLMAKIKIENGKVKADIQPQVVKKRNCDNIVYTDGDIYMTCNAVIRYGVHTDSIEATLPDPLFKVKELYSYGSMLVIMGENDFKVYHNDKLVDDIEMESMDKFLLNKNQYLAVNEFGVQFGNFSIKQPVIKCHTNDPHNEGIFNVIMTTEAQCSTQYFAKRNLDLDAPPNQTCLYTTPVQLLFWSPKDLSLIPFLVVLCLFSSLLITLILWVFFVKRREWRLKNALLGFHLAGTKTNYDVMIEQAPNPNEPIEGAASNDGKAAAAAAQPENKVEPHQQYDIGD